MTPHTQDYRIIPLSNGLFTKVDESDFELLNSHRWHAAKTGNGERVYAQRTFRCGGRAAAMWMHRFLLGLEKGDRRWADHINGDTLDNRRCNLRIATPSQNNMNKIVVGSNPLGLKGVSWHSIGKRWRARIKVDGKQIHLGLFDTVEEAHAAYVAASKVHHGEFANTRAHAHNSDVLPYYIPVK